MVIKLDIAIAFDRVNHSFSFQVLGKLGFDQASIRWIKACIGSLWVYPIINGRETKFFKIN